MAQNLKVCQILISKASSAGARALFLPEAADYIASSPSQSVSLCRSAADSVFVLGIQSAARTHGIAVNVGVHEPADVNGQAKSTETSGQRTRVKNTLLWINEQGEIAQRYQKVHLFDVDGREGMRLKESNSVQPGSRSIAPFSTPLGSVGLQICYDMRFPELALRLRRMGADLIVYPSAFTVPTGEAHWHILLKAHAIQTQSYIVAAAQVGQHNAERASYGHSLVIDPWGDVKVDLSKKGAGDVGELALFDVDLDLVGKVRQDMPLWKQRRL